MESAKKDIQIIEINSDLSRQENANEHTAAFAGRKAHPKAFKDAPEALAGRSTKPSSSTN